MRKGAQGRRFRGGTWRFVVVDVPLRSRSHSGNILLGRCDDPCGDSLGSLGGLPRSLLLARLVRSLTRALARSPGGSNLGSFVVRDVASHISLPEEARGPVHSLINQMPQALHDIVGPIQTVDVPAQGATSEVIILSSAQGRFVVKRATKPPYHEWLRQEYQVLRSLSPRINLVPKPFGYIEEGRDGGPSHWLLMQHLPGIPLREVLRRGVDATERRRLLFAFGEALATIHAEPVPDELASEEPWLDRMLRLAEVYLQKYEVDGDETLLARLKRERPEPVAPCLIHGDYTLDNVLIDDGRVSGIIDWCWGAEGDPRYDLALAIREKDEAFQDPADIEAFYNGYAGRRLTEEEMEYFVGIYEFF